MTNIYNVGSILPGDAACFSINTYKILVEKGIIDKPHAIMKNDRSFTQMYSCDWYPYGHVEFTEEHPFLYKNKIITFEELYKIHPDIKNVKIIPIDDIDTSIVYNIVSYPDQYDSRNHYKMSTDLYMIGGRFTVYVDPIYFTKKMEIIEKLNNDPDCHEIIEKKYLFTV